MQKKKLPYSLIPKNVNCKKCGYETCEIFIKHLEKNQARLNLCPIVSITLKVLPTSGTIVGRGNEIIDQLQSDTK